MRGSVEFFGLDPTNTSQIKNITLNFNGLDYAGNTILFPTGKNANGTWRIQIKGVNAGGKKITDALRDKGEENLLVEKIIVFTKIEEDYYFLSVFPSAELENFRSVSQIVARNGISNSAKEFGLL